MDYNEASMQQQVDDFMSKMARLLKASYALVTTGSQTERGGEVVNASTNMAHDGRCIACVGDVVRYPDGTESKINSGTGSALVFKDRPFAIVGSTADNDDTTDETIPGLLQPGYIVKCEPA